ncbi:CHAT domain-containing protein [Streptomyces sp. NPDC059766]|uniref:CHAT domain-containing protein n=1 Tax=Streptomyces sp. NPDC059766 TaxID=3346940 RepID=UPI0036466BFC
MGIGVNVLAGLRTAALRRRLTRRLDRHLATGGPRAVLAAQTRAVAERLAAAVTDRADLPSLQTLARFHAACSDARGPHDGRADRSRALELGRLIRELDPEAVPEPVIALAGRFDSAEQREEDPALAMVVDALQSGDGTVAVQAARLLRQELRSRPDDPERGITLSLLGTALLIGSSTATPDADLDETVDVLREATEALADDPDRASVVAQLGWALSCRYFDRRSASDRDQAIEALREGMRLAPESPAQLVLLLTELGHLLLERFAATHRPTDEEEALRALREAAARATADPGGAGDFAGLTIPPHLRPSPGRAPAFLGTAVYDRFLRAGDSADLDEAVGALRTALRFASAQGQSGVPLPGFSTSPAEENPRLHALVHLGSALISRYERDVAPEDADEAIDLLEEAARTWPSEDPGRALPYALLGGILTRMLGHRDAATDLSRGIEALRKAIVATPHTDSQRAGRLADLGQALLGRVLVGGAQYDPDEAVDTFRAAVAATEEGHPERSLRLAGLGTALWFRFQRVGGLADTDEAIRLGRLAVAAAPEGSFAEHNSLIALAGWLHGRFRRTKDDADLAEAVDAGQRAVAACRDDPASQAAAMIFLGTILQTRFQHRGVRADLDQGIEALRAAVRLRPADHPRGLALARANLANALRLSFDQGGPLSDIDEAVDALRGKLPFDSEELNRAATLCALGEALASRYRRTLEQATRREAREHLLKVADMRTAPASLRLQAAKAWTALAADVQDWSDAVAGAARASELLSLLAWRGLPRRDQERVLIDHEGLAGDAAAYALLAGDSARALEMLEHGRGVLLSRTLDTRTDIGRLRSLHPELAQRLEAIRDALDSAGAGDLLSEQVPAGAPRASGIDYEQRLLLAREWDGLVERIRRLDDSLADFLRRPGARQLQEVAAEGPIVVLNVAERRSDALILTVEELLTVPLVNVTPERVAEYVVDFYLALQDPVKLSARATMEDVLAWLWDAVAGPVLDALGHRPVPPGVTPPRLWWVPTGLLTLLPLHAAGRAGDGVLDRVMSSYAPTVGTLAHARNAAWTTGPAQVTVVALPGHDLPNAQRESKDIGTLFPGAQQLVDDRATRANVLGVLPTSHVVHFACHASQDLVNPSHGHLRLYDGALDVLEFARLRLGTAELAYLSACQTATGGIALADEAVHLASAFQLAGYRQVIGTLWPIQDAVAADIATDVYTQLRQDGGGVATRQAAAALHGAIRRARAAHPEEPHLWASHIHLGP